MRLSTKGTLLREKDYLDKLKKAPHLFWVAFSINTIDDELAKKIDINESSILILCLLRFVEIIAHIWGKPIGVGRERVRAGGGINILPPDFPPAT